MLRLRYPIAVDLKLQGRRVVVGDRLLAGEPGREPPFRERASVALAPITRQTFHSEVTGLILWPTREPPRGVALIG